MKNTINSVYYIFGTVSAEYYASDYPMFLQSCKDDDDWVLFEYKPGYTEPDALLSQFNGYRNFAQIPEQTYRLLEMIKRKQNERDKTSN